MDFHTAIASIISTTLCFCDSLWNSNHNALENVDLKTSVVKIKDRLIKYCSLIISHCHGEIMNISCCRGKIITSSGVAAKLWTSPVMVEKTEKSWTSTKFWRPTDWRTVLFMLCYKPCLYKFHTHTLNVYCTHQWKTNKFSK